MSEVLIAENNQVTPPEETTSHPDQVTDLDLYYLSKFIL